jgi:uncharacterized protein
MKTDIPGDKRKTVTLTLTGNCNFNCIYCYEKNKSGKSMPVELAKSIIYDEMTKNDSFKFVYIDFFGGEPIGLKVPERGANFRPLPFFL